MHLFFKLYIIHYLLPLSGPLFLEYLQGPIVTSTVGDVATVPCKSVVHHNSDFIFRGDFIFLVTPKGGWE